MKIELDENLPIRLVPLLIDLGDNVESFGRRPLTVGTVVSSRQLTGRSAPRDLNDMVVVAASIDRYSPSATKIKLFRSLFRGREDVYPRRFESRKTDAILRAINRRGGSPSVPVDIIPRS